MSGRPQDKTRTRCGNIADKSEDVHTLTVVKEVTSTKTFLPSVVRGADVNWRCSRCGTTGRYCPSYPCLDPGPPERKEGN